MKQVRESLGNSTCLRWNNAGKLVWAWKSICKSLNWNGCFSSCAFLGTIIRKYHYGRHYSRSRSLCFFKESIVEMERYYYEAKYSSHNLSQNNKAVLTAIDHNGFTCAHIAAMKVRDWSLIFYRSQMRSTVVASGYDRDRTTQNHDRFVALDSLRNDSKWLLDLSNL